MLRLMAEMMKLPVILFVSGMEVFVRAMREYQQMAGLTLDRTVDKIGSDEARAGDREGEAVSPPMCDCACTEAMSATNVRDPQKKERDAMIDDRALGSEDLKTVRYRIIFTKRNHETTLKEERATINYATDPMSISGRYISDFWASAAVGGEQDALKSLYAAGYRDASRTKRVKRKKDGKIIKITGKVTKKILDKEKNLHWTIKDEDKKYIAFRADLLDQLPRQKAEYERERTEELSKIREILDERL